MLAKSSNYVSPALIALLLLTGNVLAAGCRARRASSSEGGSRSTVSTDGTCYSCRRAFSEITFTYGEYKYGYWLTSQLNAFIREVYSDFDRKKPSNTSDLKDRVPNGRWEFPNQPVPIGQYSQLKIREFSLKPFEAVLSYRDVQEMISCMLDYAFYVFSRTAQGTVNPGAEINLYHTNDPIMMYALGILRIASTMGDDSDNTTVGEPSVE